MGIVILLAVLFFLGMPVGIAMAIVGFCGFWYVVSFKAAITMVGSDIWTTFSSYGLTVVPLFVFLGYLAFNSGIAERRLASGEHHLLDLRRLPTRTTGGHRYLLRSELSTRHP